MSFGISLNNLNTELPLRNFPQSKPPASLLLLVKTGLFAVCKLPATSQIPTWVSPSPFFSITKTSEELSIVCPESSMKESSIPESFSVEKSFVLIQVVGPLDFTWVGILASLTGVLAEKQISLFALSTYDTDYLLVKQNNLNVSVAALEEAGHRISFESSDSLESVSVETIEN